MKMKVRRYGLAAGGLALLLLFNGCNAGTAQESGSQNTSFRSQEESGSQNTDFSPQEESSTQNTGVRPQEESSTSSSGLNSQETGRVSGSGSGLPETEADASVPAGTAENGGEFTGIAPCNVGDTISFGSYEQDNNKENGAEEIEWIVLDADGENVLLLSKYGLDARAYNSSDAAVTWENSELRQWLNDTFYQTAFSKAQQEVIIPVTNVNPDNERWGTSGGNDTQDAVFLLSIDEAENYFSDRNETLWIQATPYAVEQGAYVADNGDSPWWLRSPGDHNEGGFCAAYVDYRPSGVSLSGYAVQYNSRAVRPALWVKTQADSASDDPSAK